MIIDLFNEEHRKLIGKFIQKEQDRLRYNEDIFKILEGNLKELVEERMIVDLGENSYKDAKHRIAPINVLKKIISKQTSIYNQPVVRTVVDGNEADLKLLRWYEETLNFNQRMHRSNALYNAYLHSLMQITLTNVNPVTRMGRPFIRSIPNHQFLVMSVDETNPTSADVIILCMPECKNDKGQKDNCFYVHTELQFVIMNDKGEIHNNLMALYEQDGFNPYKTTPFIHTNASEDLAMPMVQADNREMAILIPLLLTDLNYATKYQSFSAFVAIDCDEKEVKLAPRAIMHLKSDGAGNTPKFDVVKPSVDITETLSLASSEMSLWLTSKGIRPGAVGQIGVDQFASGVSKMIDESDTYESVKEQIVTFDRTERSFWDKLLKRIHPFWIAGNRVENTTRFSPNAYVKTEFTQPKPLQTRRELIEELKMEVEAGFATVETAVRKLNPSLDDKQVQELIIEAKSELLARRPVMNPEQQQFAN